jgi:hypothetical protein
MISSLRFKYNSFSIDRFNSVNQTFDDLSESLDKVLEKELEYLESLSQSDIDENAETIDSRINAFVELVDVFSFLVKQNDGRTVQKINNEISNRDFSSSNNALEIIEVLKICEQFIKQQYD